MTNDNGTIRMTESEYLTCTKVILGDAWDGTLYAGQVRWALQGAAEYLPNWAEAARAGFVIPCRTAPTIKVA